MSDIYEKGKGVIASALVLVAVLAPVSVAIVPTISFAQTGLVVCTGATTTDSTNPDNKLPVCDFNQFLAEMQHVINWMFIIAIPVAALLFAYGGVLYVIGTEAYRKQANMIFTRVGVGFGIMLVAWAVVYTVLGWLTGPAGPTNFVTSFLGH